MKECNQFDKTSKIPCEYVSTSPPFSLVFATIVLVLVVDRAQIVPCLSRLLFRVVGSALRIFSKNDTQATVNEKVSQSNRTYFRGDRLTRQDASRCGSGGTFVWI
jgi:hypothetical protein